MAKLNIPKEVIEKTYNNNTLTLKEKLKILGCSDSYMYAKLREFDIPTRYPKKARFKTPPEPKVVVVPEPEPNIFESDTTVDAALMTPNFQAYNLNMTFRFRPENKEDFFTALQLLAEILK